MGDRFVDGNTRVAYVASISDITAPTASELNAGILLQDTLTPDGLMGFEATTASVETDALGSTFDTTAPGRDAFSNTGLRFKRQSGTDTIFDTLTKNTTGHIVIRRGVTASTAWATGDKVEVFPVICGREKHLTPTKNAVEKYEVPTFISADPELRATVA